jgi:hypothetical protein
VVFPDDLIDGLNQRQRAGAEGFIFILDSRHRRALTITLFPKVDLCLTFVLCLVRRGERAIFCLISK